MHYWGFFFPHPFGEPTQLFDKSLHNGALTSCWLLLVVLRGLCSDLPQLVGRARLLAARMEEEGRVEEAEEVGGFVETLVKGEMSGIDGC